MIKKGLHNFSRVLGFGARDTINIIRNHPNSIGN